MRVPRRSRVATEGRGVLLAEVHYQFLLLVHEFESGRGVPFDCYVSAMLPRRVLNWAQKERCHLRREVALGQSERERKDDDPEEALFELRPSYGASEARDAELWMWWEQVLGELTERQRQVMELALQRLAEREIAEQLRISGQAVHKVKSSARKKLQEKW